MTDLEPCPFCGSAPDIAVHNGWTSVLCADQECPVQVEADFNGEDARADAIAAWNTRAPSPAARERDAMREALTPSGDTKAAYHGEFSWTETETGYTEDGEEYEDQIKRAVPWTTVKEIMAAISDRARQALNREQPA